MLDSPFREVALLLTLPRGVGQGHGSLVDRTGGHSYWRNERPGKAEPAWLLLEAPVSLDTEGCSAGSPRGSRVCVG